MENGINKSCSYFFFFFLFGFGLLFFGIDNWRKKEEEREMKLGDVDVDFVIFSNILQTSVKFGHCSGPIQASNFSISVS